VVVALARSVPFERVVRVALPFALLLLGIAVGAVAASDGRRVSYLVRAMVAAGCVSAATRYYYSTGVAGISISEMRYQLLSPALPSLIAFVVARVAYAGRMDVWTMVTAMVVTISISLSITRAFLVVPIAAVACVFLLDRLFDVRGLKIRRLWPNRFMSTAVVGAAMLCGAVVAVAARPQVLQDWIGRVTTRASATGQDVTFLTRLAEAEGVWEQVTQSASSFLFGRGFGNTYSWSAKYVAEFQTITSGLFEEFSGVWYPGHSCYTYALFFGGLFALMWQIYIVALPVIVVFAGRQQTFMSNHVLAESPWRYAFIVSSIILYTSQSFTANPLGERLAGLFMGLTTGLLLASERSKATPESSGAVWRGRLKSI
jgi:hypothetical protein